MGSPESEPGHFAGTDNFTDETQHEVTLSSGFYMGIYEVTQDQFFAIRGETPSDFKSAPAMGEVQGRRPVEQVMWYDAILFCNSLSAKEDLTPYYTINQTYGSDVNNKSSVDVYKVLVTKDETANGYRLPTEAQWEYACRAGTTTMYYFGDSSNLLDEYAWWDGNSGEKTHEVGKKLPNAWGLYDMLGNVSELCWDWLSTLPYQNGAQTDPQGSTMGSYRVVRGGSWYAWSVPPEEELRSAVRAPIDPNGDSDDVGFRVIRPSVSD